MKSVFRIRVSGVVQGVGFRYSTCRQARRLGLNGWVRNERDGSVLVHIQGEDEAAETLRRWLEKGPSYARVDHCREIPAPYDPSLVDFDITYY